MRVMIIVQNRASYPPLRYVAAASLQRGWNVQLLFGGSDSVERTLIHADASAAGFDVLDMPGDAAQPRIEPLIGHHPDPERLGSLRTHLERPLRKGWGIYQALGLTVAGALAFFELQRPDLIIVAEDGITGPLLLLGVARHLGIPILDVPYGFSFRVDLEVDLDRKASEGTLITPTGPFGDAVVGFAPQWVKSGKHAGVVMQNPVYIAALEAIGIALPDPWVVHGGLAWQLCVEGERSLAFYRSEGIPERKLTMTGTPYCDIVLDGLKKDPIARAAFLNGRRITSGTTRILVSWPPSYHSSRGIFSEFGTYESMTEALLRGLAAISGAEVTVSLHPAVTTETRNLVASWGLVVSDEYLIELIPRHDVFVGYFSSTMRWAIAAGKPVLNYDAYRLGFTYFDGVPGLRTLSSVADVLGHATQLARDDHAFETAARAQASEAWTWGVIDGRATDRVLDLGASLARLASSLR